MIVEVKPFKVRDMITKQQRDSGMYQIIVDGQRLGFIGYHNDAKPMIHQRLSPMELDEITRAVNEQLPKQNTGDAVQVSEKPPTTPTEKQPHDDFD